MLIKSYKEKEQWDSFKMKLVKGMMESLEKGSRRNANAPQKRRNRGNRPKTSLVVSTLSAGSPEDKTGPTRRTSVLDDVFVPDSDKIKDILLNMTTVNGESEQREPLTIKRRTHSSGFMSSLLNLAERERQRRGNVSESSMINMHNNGIDASA